MRNLSILINQLSYFTPVGKAIFNGLNLSITGHKIGLVGRNGCGKSTLLKLIHGELQPDAGSIEVSKKITYLPQNLVSFANETVAQVLGITERLTALHRIMLGSTAEKDFTLLNEDWLVEERVRQQLESFGLGLVHLQQTVSELSGGEATRLFLLKLFTSDAEILLLDEPTNNLDNRARQIFYQQLHQWRGMALIATHDRVLLGQVEQIIELSPLGVQIYGGNFQDYLEQKIITAAAKERRYEDAKKVLQETQTSVQLSREKHDQRRAKGQAERKAGKLDKMGANSAKGRSEKTQGRLAAQKESLLQDAQSQFQAAKAKIEISDEIKIDLHKTYVPNGKMVVAIENLTFAYSPDKPLLNNFNLTLQGPEHVALVGANGSGKTTLVKLILEEIQPQQGSIRRGVTQIRYLDQHAVLLQSKQTLLENFMRLNPGAKEQDARHALAQFLFRNDDALKVAADLSDGERLRALLACVLLSDNPPQLLILDEPTNHLDLTSIARIESALRCYQGALLVISHDPVFLDNTKIERTIGLHISSIGV